jgi:hypothetical protein
MVTCFFGLYVTPFISSPVASPSGGGGYTTVTKNFSTRMFNPTYDESKHPIITLKFQDEEHKIYIVPNDMELKNYTIVSEDLNLYTVVTDIQFIPQEVNPSMTWKH